MDTISLAITIYIAAALGVSGAAKLARPDKFAETLNIQGIIPSIWILSFSRWFPAAEVGVAVWLLSGMAFQAASFLAMSLFASFCAIEAYLVLTGRATDCGCFGVAFRLRVDMISIVVSLTQTLAAGVLVWNAAHGVDLLGGERVVPMAAFGLVGLALSPRIWVTRSYATGLKDNLEFFKTWKSEKSP